jgi:ferrous iron transport protein A
MTAPTLLALDRLRRGQLALVTGFSAERPELVAKLREIGFAEGDEVEVLARGPIAGAPLSVRLNRTIIALRKAEAAAIAVELRP